LVGIAITALVYGAVALIVKMDDIGLHLAVGGRLGATRALGRGLVKGMPGVMWLLSTVGTAAMLWVGGSIVVHGLEVLGLPWLGHIIVHLSGRACMALLQAGAAMDWYVTAALDVIFGLLLVLALVPLAIVVLAPVLPAPRR